MNTPDFPFLKAAILAAEKAGRFLKKEVGKKRIIWQKSGEIDLVTDADWAVQKLIIDFLKKHYPHHHFLAEEEKTKKQKKGYTWVIDPIDGTSAFSCGLPTYSSSIALLKGKEILVGAIYLAISHEAIWAERGKGVFRKKGRLSVSLKKDLKKAVVGFDPGYFNRQETIGKIAALLSDKVLILPMLWSQATALALVAQGILDGYIQCGSPKIYDVAAGKLLVEEAKGLVTDFSGKDLDLFKINGYVAGNPSIHQQLLKFIHGEISPFSFS